MSLAGTQSAAIVRPEYRVHCLSTPGAYAYFDTALQPDSSTGGIITGSMYPTTPPPAYPGASFYDAFVIHVTDSLGDSN